MSPSATTKAPTATAFRVLFADKFPEPGIEALRTHGCAVVSDVGLKPETLPAALAEHDPDVLVVRSTKVPEAALKAGPRLSLVVRAGAGTDNIDVAAASARGIFVTNCPGKNALAVAELAWGLIIACDRRIPDQTIDLRKGRWAKSEYARARGLAGRTLGVVGLGTIGLAVIERARGFGMPVVAWSRSLTPERARTLGVEHAATPLDVARAADVVSIHVAATEETKHLVNAEFCAAMKPGATLVNTSRGSVVDEAALARAVGEKELRVGLDVWANQPAPTDDTIGNPIINEPGVIGTHHVGASTDQAQEAISAETLRIIQDYRRTGVVHNCINRAAASPATCLLTVRHLNRAGVLAHVFRVLSVADINVEEMENLIYEGAAAACARIQLDAEPTPAQLDEIRANPHMLSVDLTSMST